MFLEYTVDGTQNKCLKMNYRLCGMIIRPTLKIMV